MSGTRERRGVFGEVADAYEAARPGYPAALVDEVLAHVRLGGSPALEVGAGTGKASIAFAAHGIDLTCIEPDPRMAAVLTGSAGPYPRCTAVVTDFERWQPPAERYGLLFSAQAWHWIDPAVRWTLAFDALRPGGSIALFWNFGSVPDPDLRSAVEEAHARHGAAELAGATLGGPEPSEDDPDGDWPLVQLTADDRYVDVETRRYSGGHAFTSGRYVDLLASISAYRLLPEEQRLPLLADVARAVELQTASFEYRTATHLYLARTRA